MFNKSLLILVVVLMTSCSAHVSVLEDTSISLNRIEKVDLEKASTVTPT